MCYIGLGNIEMQTNLKQPVSVSRGEIVCASIILVTVAGIRLPRNMDLWVGETHGPMGRGNPWTLWVGETHGPYG